MTAPTGRHHGPAAGRPAGAAEPSAIVVAAGPAAAAGAERWAAAEAGLAGERARARIWRPAPSLVIAASDALPGRDAPTVALRESLLVVADAALYYRADLRRAIAAGGVEPPQSDEPAQLLAAAYLARGTRMGELLEGDLAFALWDGRRRLLLLGRDALGRRPLHHALPDDTLVAASRASAVADHPLRPRTFDLAVIGATAAGLPEVGWRTAWRDVAALPTGRTMVVRLGREERVERVSVHRHWTPPTFESGGGPPFADAAVELREAIVAATAERLDPARPTAVWLSGGWDSPAVYGAGHEAARRGLAPAAPLAVTMSYPPGDPGREDELVEEIVAHWGAGVAAWCDADDVPLLGDAVGEAATRDLPLAHPYGEWSRALARATVSAGARIALDGGGGDQLFQVSPIYLADLVARLRLVAARREWRARGMTGLGWRRFVQYAIHPLAPAPLLRLATLLRGGRPVPGARAWPVPPWIRADFARAHALARFGRPVGERRAGERHSAAESRWYFESAYPPAILRAQAEVVAGEGLELRSPLLDPRVIALAARRPRAERSAGGETKRLLRAAARGLVPDPLLAPRPSRTGVTSGYFERALRRGLPALARFVIDESALVALGIVDPGAFAAAVAELERGRHGPHDLALLYTVQAELWLRARPG